MEQDGDSFFAQVKQLLTQESVGELKRILVEDQHRQDFVVHGWDIVSEICEYLTDDVKNRSPNLLYVCEDFLIAAATHGNAKELLLAFLEQLDQFKDDVKFKALMSPLQICLARLPAKRQNSLDITLETVYAHIKSLPKPEFHDLEGDEKGLLEADPIVGRASDAVTAVLDFIDPFVTEVETKRHANDGSKELDSKVVYQQLQITRFLLQILDYPLRFIDMEYRDGCVTKSRVRIVGESLMVLLGRLHGDLDAMLNDVVLSNYRISINKPEDDDVSEKLWANEKVSEVALGCFLYLLHHEEVCIDSYPWTFTALHRFDSCLPFINALLSDEHAYVTTKGVLLSGTLVDNIPTNSVSETIMEMPEFDSFVRKLLHVITYCPSKVVRQNGVKILPRLLSMLTVSGRGKFLMFALNIGTHSGVLGYTIHLLKEEISHLLMTAENEMFSAKTMQYFYQMIFRLKDGTTSDLLEDSDRIMAALNLLRFLVIRDKNDVNKTGVWSSIANAEEHFLKPLRTAIDLSRAHYELELKDTAGGKKDKTSAEMSVSVGGQSVPKVDNKQHAAMIRLALHTFDMMDSVLARVNELMEGNK